MYTKNYYIIKGKHYAMTLVKKLCNPYPLPSTIDHIEGTEPSPLLVIRPTIPINRSSGSLDSKVRIVRAVRHAGPPTVTTLRLATISSFLFGATKSNT